MMLDQAAIAVRLLAPSRGRLSAHSGYIWMIVHTDAFDAHGSQWDSLMLHETKHCTDLLSSGPFFHFPCFKMVMVHSDWGCLDYTVLPRSIQLLLCEQNWAIVISAAALDAWEALVDVCWIFEDWLSLVLFWFYCFQSATGSIDLLISSFIQHL